MGIYRGKRALDLGLLLVSAPVTLLLLGLTALAVRVFIGSPVLFHQLRPGRGEKPFRLIKFRTMTMRTDAQGHLLPDAERLTGVGRLLRSLSLDELPELLNVLRGDMSIVGPRPLLMEYLPRYSSRQRRRHEVPPGLTGLAQVSGRNALSWDEKFELDVEYVDRCSPGLDLVILLRTLRTLVARDGISAPGDATMPIFWGSHGAPGAIGSAAGTEAPLDSYSSNPVP